MVLAEHHELVLAAVSVDGDHGVVDVRLEPAMIEKILDPRIAEVLFAVADLGVALWGQLRRYKFPARTRLIARITSSTYI